MIFGKQKEQFRRTKLGKNISECSNKRMLLEVDFEECEWKIDKWRTNINIGSIRLREDDSSKSVIRETLFR